MLVVFATDVQRSSIWHRLLGVNGEIGDHLTDLSGVDFCPPQVGADSEFAATVRTPQGEANGVLNEPANRGHLFDRRAAAGEGQQLLREIARPKRSVFRVI